MTVSTPGRICLFGEHQDYLGLPVIAAAISLRIRLSVTRWDTPEAVVHMPDIDQNDIIPLDRDLEYRHHRDYLRSAVNVIRHAGYSISGGAEIEVNGEIPINSGTSSSSALLVTWVNVLTWMSSTLKTPDAEKIASLAHRAEVLEFHEPGGMMDHYSTALGGVIFLDTHKERHIETLHPSLGPFVLADSGEEKDTKAILARVKDRVLAIYDRIQKIDPHMSLRTLKVTDAEQFSDVLTENEIRLLVATLANRDITYQARDLLRQKDLDHKAVGRLLHRHQSNLRDPLGISTSKIDSMIQAAYDAGALGAKINGSGGGGCMFAYAPNDPQSVLEALRPFGRAWIVTVDEGTRVDEV